MYDDKSLVDKAFLYRPVHSKIVHVVRKETPLLGSNIGIDSLLGTRSEIKQFPVSINIITAIRTFRGAQHPEAIYA